MAALENRYPKIPGEEHLNQAIAEGVEGLRDVGRLFHGFKWSLGTSSNYSVVLQRDPMRILLTSSGNDKRLLREQDFVECVMELGRVAEVLCCGGRRSWLYCLVGS